MKSDEEFIKGIYEKAAAIQSLPAQNEPKRRSFTWKGWSGLAAACFCVLIAGVAVSNGKLWEHSDTDGGNGAASADYAGNDAGTYAQNRMVEPEDMNAGIATMSLNEQSYVHGTVQEITELMEAVSGCSASVNIQLLDSAGIAVIYTVDSNGWELGEEVWLLIDMEEDGDYLRDERNKFTLAEDGLFYNAAGVVFDNNMVE